MMTGGTYDDQYLVWLHDELVEVNPRRRFGTKEWRLFKQLYCIPFTSFIGNDDNRAADGRELRHQWAAMAGVRPTSEWFSLECSFLEMLIGLSIKLAFQAEKDHHFWFWKLLDNLDILQYMGKGRYSEREIEARVKAVIDRTYEQDGRGGLFPLRRTSNDQRKVEIWYQMSEYLLESM